MQTNDRISAIRARCDKATPGPWKVVEGKSFGVQSESKNIASCFRTENEQFIAHSREDIPFLLAQLAAKDAEIERLRLACELADYVKETIFDRVSKSTGRMTVSQDLYFAVKRLDIALRHVLPAAPEKGE